MHHIWCDSSSTTKDLFVCRHYSAFKRLSDAHPMVIHIFLDQNSQSLLDVKRDIVTIESMPISDSEEMQIALVQ